MDLRGGSGIQAPDWWPFEAIDYELIFCSHCENTFFPSQAVPKGERSAGCPHCGSSPLDWQDWEEVRARRAN